MRPFPFILVAALGLASCKPAPIQPSHPEPAPAAPAEPAKPPPPPGPVAPPDLGLTLIRIEPGFFVMGSPAAEPWRSADPVTGEGPQTTVTVSRVFWMARTETTRAQYEAIMGPVPDPWPKKVAEEWAAAKADPGSFPVVNVTWDQANAFCAKLTERERAAGRIPASMRYHLPTEAQWEYACRAGTTGRNPAADNDDALVGIAWYVKTAGPFNRSVMPRIQPVAGKRANPWGLHDMLGNAREWTLDFIGPYPGGVVTDPTGPAAPVKDNLAFRVQRGGAWIDTKGRVRSAARNWSAPEFGAKEGFREGTVGFRVVVTGEPAGSP